MIKSKKYLCIKVWCGVVVSCLLISDVAWAYPVYFDTKNSCLAAHSVFQQEPISESDEAGSKAFFLRAGLLLSANDIGDYLFGDPQHEIGPLPIKALETAVSSSTLKLRGASEQLELSATRAITIRNGALTTIPPNEKVTPDSAIVIPCRNDAGVRYLALVLLKDNPSSQNFAGYELAVLDKYIVKIVKETPGQPLASAEDTTKARGSSSAVRHNPNPFDTQSIVDYRHISNGYLRSVMEGKILGVDLIEYQRPVNINEARRDADDFINAIHAILRKEEVRFANEEDLIVYLRKRFGVRKFVFGGGKGTRFTPEGIVVKTLFKPDGCNSQLKLSRMAAAFGTLEDIIVIDPVTMFNILKDNVEITGPLKNKMRDRLEAVFSNLIEDNVLEKREAKEILEYINKVIERDLLYTRRHDGLRDLAMIMVEIAKRAERRFGRRSVLSEAIVDKAAYAIFGILMEEDGLIDETRKDDLLGKNCILTPDSADGIGMGYLEALDKLGKTGKLEEARYSIIVYGDSEGWGLDKYQNIFFKTYLEAIKISAAENGFQPKVTMAVKNPRDGRAEGRARVFLAETSTYGKIPIHLKEWNDMTDQERQQSKSMAEARDPSWFTNSQIFVIDTKWSHDNKDILQKKYRHRFGKAGDIKRKPWEWWVSDYINIAGEEYAALASRNITQTPLTHYLLIHSKAPDAPKRFQQAIIFRDELNNMLITNLRGMGVEVSEGTVISISIDNILPGFTWGQVLSDIFGSDTKVEGGIDTTKLRGTIHLSSTTKIGKGAVLDGTGPAISLTGACWVNAGVKLNGVKAHNKTFEKDISGEGRRSPRQIERPIVTNSMATGPVLASDLIKIGIVADSTTRLWLITKKNGVSKEKVLKRIFGNRVGRNKVIDQIYLYGDVILDERCRIENGTMLDGRGGRMELFNTFVGKGAQLARVRAADTIFQRKQDFSAYRYEQPALNIEPPISDSNFNSSYIETGGIVKYSRVCGSYISATAEVYASDIADIVAVEHEKIKGRDRYDAHPAVAPSKEDPGSGYVQGICRLGELEESDKEAIISAQMKMAIDSCRIFIIDPTARKRAINNIHAFLYSTQINRFTVQQIRDYVISKIRSSPKAKDYSLFARPLIESARNYARDVMKKIDDLDVDNKPQARAMFRKLAMLATRFNAIDFSIDTKKSNIMNLIADVEKGSVSIEKIIGGMVRDRLAVDGLNQFEDLIFTPQKGTFLYLTDNFGETEIDALLWYFIIKMGHKVVISPKDYFSLGDIDIAGVEEVIDAYPALRGYKKSGKITIVRSGSSSEGIFPSRFSKGLKKAFANKDLKAIISKGQANLFCLAARNKLQVPFVTMLLSKSISSARVTGIPGDKPFWPIIAVIPANVSIFEVLGKSRFKSDFRALGKLDEEIKSTVPKPEKPRRQVPQGVLALIERINSQSISTDAAEKMFVESWDTSWGRLIEFDRPKSFRSYFVFPDTTLRYVVDKNGKVRITDVEIPKLQYRGDNVDLSRYRTNSLFIEDVIVDLNSKNVEFKFGVKRLKNASVEAVGVLRPGQDSICVSVATGCIGTPGCRFCGTGEKTVNKEIKAAGLTKDEIKDQVMLVLRFVQDTIYADFGKNDIQLSMMGMGEPLLYPDATLGAIFELEKAGYITKTRISTTANVRMLKTMEEKVLRIFTHDVRPPMLQLSLQSAREDVRRSLVRVPEFISPADDLIAFIIAYNRATGILDRVDVRVSLMKGINDSEEDARKLAVKIHDICKREHYNGDFHIKVTPINPIVPGFTPPDEVTMDSYVKVVRDLGFSNIFAFRTGGDPHDRSQAGRVTCGTLVGKAGNISQRPDKQTLRAEGMLPPSMDFIVTERCSEECKICFAATMPPHREASLEEQKRMIDHMYGNGVRRLIFTGGEPLLAKHIGALLSYAHDKGMATALYTNGRFLDEAKAAEIMPYVDMISFPMDGYDEESNVHNGKIPGRFTDTLRALQLIRDKYPSKEIQVLTIVTKHNMDYLEKIGKLLLREARNIPSFHWKLSYYDRRGRSVESFPDAAKDPYYLSYDEFLKIVEPMRSKFQDIHARYSPRARDRAYLFMFADGVLATTEADKYIEFGNILFDSTLNDSANRIVFEEITANIIPRAVPIAREIMENGGEKGMPNAPPAPRAKATNSEMETSNIILLNMPSPKYPRLDRPLGLEVLKGHLLERFQKKVDVEILDLQLDKDIDAIVEKIVNEEPDVLGVSLGVDSEQTLNKILEKIDERMPEDAQPYLVIGGMVATFAPDELLKRYSDRKKLIVVVGEGEEAIEGIIDFLNSKRTLEQVPNITFAKDARPRPNRSFLTGEKMSLPSTDTVTRVAGLNGVVWVEASRGCAHNCAFCSRRELRQGHGWTPKPLENVFEEIRQLAMLGVRRVSFSDDNLVATGNIKHKYGLQRIEDIANGIKKISQELGLDIVWEGEVRADALYDSHDTQADRFERGRIWHLAKDSGLARLFIGIESGSDGQLKRYNKGITAEENERALRFAEEIGIDTSMMGFIT
ncbi:MAG: radical SAM protein, partial [Candidatus Omnitrophica bacterium]|nr:radical SAM protein [Candidatus Omnitrophota bacterium]